MPLDALLLSCLSPDESAAVCAELVVPALPSIDAATVSRAQLSQALTMILFHDLLRRVPDARDYVTHDVVARGQRVVFDHGAIRTVRWPCGALPAGEDAFTRILGPLGYRVEGVYPLPRLRMTGRAWCHLDAPEEMPQFFVSELHPEQFSDQFQAAVSRVIGASRDPLTAADLHDLDTLAREQALPLSNALRLLPALVKCFDRQHGVFSLADYELLRAESPEMAWIATEGNAFNHATDRVADVVAVAEEQKRLGRPMKPSVEVSASGRVRQTAFRAAEVQREFEAAGAIVSRAVPGSFYEFISRDPLPATPQAATGLDLAFDAGNATGIFAMTAGASPSASPAGASSPSAAASTSA